MIIGASARCDRVCTVLLVVSCALSGGCRRGEGARSCLVELAAPAYPHIAVSARVRVTGIQAAVRIQNGQVVDIQQVYPADAARLGPLFKDAVDKAVRRSRFDEGCGDRTEEIIYDFVYADPVYRDPPEQERVSFVPPNRVIVATTGTLINTSNEPR